MRRNVFAVVAGLAVMAPAVAVAQESGPRAGSWGAETNLNSEVSLLNFRSSTSAWLIGFSLFYDERKEEGAPGGFEFESEIFAATLRLGLRGYRAPDSRFRPFHTFAGLVGYNDTDLGSLWSFGGEFEYGGAYFFTPHVSLGASWALRAAYGIGSREQPLGGEVDATEISVNTGLRFLGAVYF